MKTATPTFAELLRAEVRAGQAESGLVKHEQAEVAEIEAEPVEMGLSIAGIGSGIDNKLPFPLVQVGIGGVAGLLVGELIDGYAAPKQGGKMNFANVIGKGVAVVIMAGPGRKYMGNVGAMAFGTVLAVQVLADVLPVSDWAASLKKMIPSGTGKAPANQPFPITPTSQDRIGAWFGK